MPTGNLPPEGKKLWEEVYEKAKKGSCKDSDDVEKCAAGSAWKAVKNAGWKKQGDKWVKGKSLAEFSLTIKKASLDPETGEMRWRADTSDTEIDHYGDRMSLALYNDFLERIEKGEHAPEDVTSEFWNGGMPYVSISHYPDLNGDGVPGEVTALYVDGNFLKAKGIFYDNPLGKRCWEAVKKDLSEDDENKVRVSIAFLDYKHKHLSTGYEYEPLGEDPLCPECLKEFFTGEYGGKEYQRGYLVHLALTRVPANERTLMEVDRSMTTRKEDAESIVGELAEDLEEKALEINKALVIKAETEDEEAQEVLLNLAHRLDGLEQGLVEIKALLEERKKDEKKDDEEEMDEEEEDKKKKEMKSEVVEAKSEVVQLAELLAPALDGINQQLGILIESANRNTAERQQYPQRRSLDPNVVQQQLTERYDPNKPVSISEYARRSVLGK